MNNNISPWLGLASYEEKHSHLFYGRAKEIEDLFSNIVHNTHNVVYGPSGTGKSSVIKAGIFKKARESNMLPVYIRLNHESQVSYSSQVISLIESEIKRTESEIEKIIQPIGETESSLWEFFHSNAFWTKDNFPLKPLIVIDQFEEIFTLNQDRNRIADFFDQLADICDNTVPKYIREHAVEKNIRLNYPDDINFRLVIILREDFLARMEEMAVNIPSLQKNRFSLQALNEEQAMEIIMKPGQEIVKDEVAINIIKKVTNCEDFKIDGIPEITVEPSILSLFCAELNQKRIEKKSSQITHELIEDFGENILKEFYGKTIGQISEKSANFLEESLLTGSGFRDSIASEDAMTHGVTGEEIEYLRKNRIIRICDRDGAKRIEYTHDILCRVVKENRDKRRNEKELKEERFFKG
ncbi:MAG: ATP-binding protein [Salinivirgaceae bacterium]|nr:ATP-binding protein [Salinivirgaceae bacterium]